MKRKDPGSARRPYVIPVWTYDQVRNAFPYVSSVLQTVREYHIEAQGHDLRAGRLAKRHGRPDRRAILAHLEEVQAAQRAGKRSEEALEELQSLGICCTDPVRGEALIPFVHDQQLAWFIYQLYDETPIRSWRLHTDSPDVRRPMGEHDSALATQTPKPEDN
jgi:hypothetical protein